MRKRSRDLIEAALPRWRVMADLHENGLTHRQIGQRFGVTQQRVQQIFKQYKRAVAILDG